MRALHAFTPILAVTLLASEQALTVAAGPRASGRAPVVGHSDGIRTLSFSSDGRLQASGSGDGTIKLWEVTSGRLLRTIAAHRDGVFEVWFVARSRRLVSVGGDKALGVWDPETGSRLKEVAVRMGPYALSPDGRTLACSRKSDVEPVGEVAQVDVEGGRESARLAAPGVGEIGAVAYSPDGARVAAVGAGERGCGAQRECGYLFVWDAASGRLVERARIETHDVSAMAFSPDGARIAGAGGSVGGGTVDVWDTSGRTRWKRRGEPDRGLTLAFSRDGRKLYSGGRFSSAAAWSTATGRLLRRFPRDVDSVVALAVSPDGSLLAQGGSWRSPSVVLRDAATGRLRWQHQGRRAGSLPLSLVRHAR